MKYWKAFLLAILYLIYLSFFSRAVALKLYCQRLGRAVNRETLGRTHLVIAAEASKQSDGINWYKKRWHKITYKRSR